MWSDGVWGPADALQRMQRGARRTLVLLEALPGGALAVAPQASLCIEAAVVARPGHIIFPHGV